MPDTAPSSAKPSTATSPTSPTSVSGPRPWWQDAVVYQIYPQSFADADGDGIGDLAGITSRLDYLADVLGVDAIWICPFYPSPGIDSGYDISAFTQVAPVYGTLQAFDELLSAAHQRGVRVLIDFVPNHTSDEHPWFIESRSSRDNPKRDWYVWADPAPDGGPPSNWTSEQGGSTWQLDPPTGQYYLHSFHVRMPDLNWRQPALRRAMLDVLRFWLARGVDGVRIDVAHLIAKDPDLTDNPPAPGQVANPNDRQHADYDTQLHLHDRLHPDLHQYLREIRSCLDECSRVTGRERVAIGELEVLPWDRWRRFFGVRLDELHLPFNFHIIEAPWTAAGLRASIEDQESALPTQAWPNYVLSNHDRPRLISRHGPASARIGMLLLLTLRGTPTLYYGDELGLRDLALPRHTWRDSLGRDQSRAPMPWTSGRHGGFGPPSGAEPWLPLPPDPDVATQLADPDSPLNFTCRLLALRRSRDSLRAGSYQSMPGTPDTCLGYLRTGQDGTTATVINFGMTEARIPLPSRAALLLSTVPDVSQVPVGTELRLRPEEGVLLELESGEDIR